jgi:drug/metabolite transporter (DMT)-like permease
MSRIVDRATGRCGASLHCGLRAGLCQGFGIVISLVFAGAAAISYGAATILQALGVRRIGGVDQQASLWTRVGSGRVYGLGLLLDGLGFVASVVALRELPLFLVEAVVASSVAVTAVLAVVVLHVRLRSAEVAALTVTILGLIVLALCAQPGPAHHLGTTAAWLLLGSVAVLAIALLVALRDPDATRASLVLATVSGAGFGIVGIAARTLRVSAPWWLTITQPVLWALALQGVLASVAFGFALHRGRTTTVAAITFAVETVFPAAVGLAFLGDAVRPHLGPFAAIGFLATLGGCIALARYAESPLPP